MLRMSLHFFTRTSKSLLRLNFMKSFSASKCSYFAIFHEAFLPDNVERILLYTTLEKHKVIHPEKTSDCITKDDFYSIQINLL